MSNEDVTTGELMVKIETVEKKVDTLADELQDLRDWITKYKGFLGGIVFVVAIIWGILMFLKTWILKTVTGV